MTRSLRLTLATATIIAGSLYDASANRELARMKKLVEIAHDQILEEKCPDPDVPVAKRSIRQITDDGVHLEMMTKLFGHLRSILIRCRIDRQQRQSTTATPSTTTLTTTPSTTTTAPLPQQCGTAINLTEVWRLDYSGSNIYPVNGRHNGDTLRMINQGRPWFRFSGQAGVQLLNRCVSHRSCGTAVKLFTNSTMPVDVGVITSIDLYGADGGGNCQFAIDRASVLRCSDRPHDFVYRYDGNDRRSDIGFCGMVA